MVILLTEWILIKHKTMSKALDLLVAHHLLLLLLKLLLGLLLLCGLIIGWF
jgi:hypothetical protein